MPRNEVAGEKSYCSFPQGVALLLIGPVIFHLCLHAPKGYAPSGQGQSHPARPRR